MKDIIFSDNVAEQEREEVLAELKAGKSAVQIADDRKLTVSAVCSIRNEAIISGELKGEGDSE